MRSKLVSCINSTEVDKPNQFELHVFLVVHLNKYITRPAPEENSLGIT